MTTPPSQIDQYLDDQIERRMRALINAFEYVGVQCQNEAKTGGTYKDRTGHLRSSVGYIVIKDGVVISGGEFDNNKGGSEGSSVIQKAISKNSKGIVLIVVAGMNYAASVEARNLNVLTSAELLADQMVPILMKQLGFTL